MCFLLAPEVTVSILAVNAYLDNILWVTVTDI